MVTKENLLKIKEDLKNTSHRALLFIARLLEIPKAYILDKDELIDEITKLKFPGHL
jgi:hypothetical protein